MNKTPVALAIALCAAPIGAQAYTLATFDIGQLVPAAWFVSGGGATYVGLISRCAGTLHWTWFNEQSEHMVDDFQPLTRDDLWSWSLLQYGPGFADQPGYAVFLFDREDPAIMPYRPGQGDGVLDGFDEQQCLATSAFWVDLPNNDIASVPTFPLTLTDINPDWAKDLGTPAPDYNAIVALAAGAQQGSLIYKRYFVDGILGNPNTTFIVTWTVCKPPRSQSLKWYSDDQDSVSANYRTPNDQLNWFDPEPTLVATTGGAFTDGFIPWVVKAAPNPNAPDAGADDNLRYCDHKNYAEVPSESQAAVSFSQIYHVAFGAQQTLVNPHIKPPADLGP